MMQPGSLDLKAPITSDWNSLSLAIFFLLIRQKVNEWMRQHPIPSIIVVVITAERARSRFLGVTWDYSKLFSLNDFLSTRAFDTAESIGDFDFNEI